jgi:undecaprenyl-diphosphatase
MTLIFGVLLYISDKSKSTRNLKNNFSYKSAIIIGVFQIFSLIPGVSRLGISVTAARILKFNRVDAGKISFLLSIPTLGAVSIFGFKNLIYTDDFSFSIMNLTGIILSFVFSIITIKYFLKFLEKFSLNAFVIYRIILGLIIIIYSYL